jgi:hypothetical protein
MKKMMHAGGWTFAVYAHYDRGRLFNAHPKVFVTYRGGNNHKPAHFYADRHMAMNNGHSNKGHFGGRR